MIFARARTLLIGGQDFPFFELYIKVLAYFPKNVDEHQVVIEYSILILASEANNAIVFHLVPIVGFKLVSLNDLVPADPLICFSLVPHSEDKRIQ